MTIGIIAYATSMPYVDMLRQLGKTVRNSGLPFKTRIPTHLWNCSWVDAVCWKPQFILDELCDTSLEGLIYTDADSKMLKRPPVEQLDGVDIGLHYFHRTPGSPGEALTGTMYFRKTSRVIEFLEAWATKTQQAHGQFTPEQDAFLDVASWSCFQDLKVKALPPEWCFIFDDMRAMYPKAEPYFEHYQASRKYRLRQAEVQA